MAAVVILVPRDPDPRALGGALVLVVLTLGLWQGIWPAWLALTLVTIADLIFLITKPNWVRVWGVAINAPLLILLLAPPTRRYARRWRPRALSR